MEENTNLVELKEMQEEEKETPIEYYIGASILGAVGSVLAFYFYNHLSEDSKGSIKENIISFAKKQLAKFCDE